MLYILTIIKQYLNIFIDTISYLTEHFLIFQIVLSEEVVEHVVYKYDIREV